MICALAVTAIPAKLRAQQESHPPTPAAPELQVEYLGSDRGFAVTGQSATMLCVVRNVGKGPLPENSARIRCYPLAGLDFMEGELWPTIPPLAPNQAVAYRWRLALADAATPLVFSVLITKVEHSATEPDSRSHGGPHVLQTVPEVAVAPSISVAPVPRFASSPHLLGMATAGKSPEAFAGHGTARVGNDRALINVISAQDRIPVLVLAGREGAEWKAVAIGGPCVQIRSAEEGQLPWTDSFRWSDASAQQSRDSAVLTLQGTVGDLWSARLSFESRPDTGVIYGSVRLTARRTLRVYGIQLPRLLATSQSGGSPVKADGSAALLAPDPDPLAGEERLSAAHSGGLVFGIAWPAAPPLTGWRSARLPAGDVEHLPVLGGEWLGDDRGEVVLAGVTMELPFRLFVFGPSDTVRDALRFRIP
jgi:hypothetical protein